ncbi:MAG: HAD hydrolase family protein, partial [Promethearchaeota archaeon]
EFNIQSANKSFQNIKNDVDLLVKEILQRFIDSGKELSKVVSDLNDFFWKKGKSDYVKAMNQIEVRGGKRKELAVEKISNQTRVPISQIVALGDSITDINMLQRLKDEDGIAISFNGNRFTVSRANIAITTTNNLGTLPIFEYEDNIDAFLESWEKQYESFKNNPIKIPKSLVTKEIKNYFVHHKFVPDIENLKTKSKGEIDLIISKQEKMRKIVRGWAGNLG